MQVLYDYGSYRIYLRIVPTSNTGSWNLAELNWGEGQQGIVVVRMVWRVLVAAPHGGFHLNQFSQ